MPAARGAARSVSKRTSKATIPVVRAREAYPVPIVLVSGKEDFFASTATSLIKQTLVLEDPELEVTELAASGYSAGELSSYVSPSLFLEPRLVLIDGAESCTDAFITDVLSYLETPVDGTTIVLRHRGGQRGKKLLDAIRSAPQGVAIEVSCEPLKANELVDFVMGEFTAERRRIVPQAAQQLVSAFNADLAELASACRQLMTLTEDVITEELIDKYYGGRVETTGFKIADAAIAGRVREALALARHGFSTGIHPVPIVAACANKLRTMAKVSDLRGTDAQLASQVGGAPWMIGQARRELRGWDDASLGRAIELVAETDHRVKGGSKDAEFAVERMLRMIATRQL